MELKHRIPEYVKKVLHLLNASGFSAYITGGAVRDILLQKIPCDFDIATSATPEHLKNLLKKNNIDCVDNLGNNFGCTVAVIDGFTVEITTFRGELYTYADAHRPAQVWYCKSLEDDLKRRDFTVNAMAIDKDGKLLDPLCGQRDLEQRLLRPVGRAAQRYREDSLRMFRACRLVAQTGFTYVQDEDALPPFGQENTPYRLNPSYRFPTAHTSGLSLERVRIELDKMLTAPHAGNGFMLFLASGLASASCNRREGSREYLTELLPELEHLAYLKQNPLYHCYDVWEHTLAALDNSPADLAIRWAVLLHDVGKGMPGIRQQNGSGQPSDHGHEALSASMADVILRRLGYSEKFTREVVWLISRHMRFAPMLISGERSLLHWVRTEALSGFFRNNKILREHFEKLTAVFLADMGATQGGKNSALMAEGKELGKQVSAVAANMPVHSSDLNISGQELLYMISDVRIAEVFTYLLKRVQSGNLPNENTALRNAVKSKLARSKTTSAKTSD